MDAKFPFLKDPEKWQAAYTADNAYYDAGAISPIASLVGTTSLIIALLYSIIFLFAILPLNQHLFNLDPGFTKALDAGKVTETLHEAFQGQGWILTEKAAITTQQAGSEWTIQDENMQYIIRKKRETLNVYERQNGVMFLLSKLYIKQYLFSLDPVFAEMLNVSQVSVPIREAFQIKSKLLTADATIIVEQAGSKWVIRDANKQYLIRYERQTLKVYAKQDWPIAFGVMVITAVLVYVAVKRVKKIAFRHAKEFFWEFYIPPASVIPADVIDYRVSSRIKLPMPFSEWFPSISQFRYILVQNGEFLKKDDWPAWLARNIGGPILLIVFDGSALYIERGNRFSRVVGPGVSFLERYETIKYAVDLRTKSKTGDISVWTKDGIIVGLTICIEYRVGDPQKISTKPQLIYPYDPEAVKKAIERYAVRWSVPTEEPSEFTWEDAIWGQISGVVPGYIGSRFLDDLLVADRNSGQILSPDATNEIFNALNNAANAFGVYVTDFQILSIKIPQEVGDYYVKYWEAEKQSLTTIMDGKAKAFGIRAHEKVRADAQHDLILAIADGLRKNNSGRLTEALLLSLSEILDHGLSDPYMRSYTARETLETLEKLQDLLEKPQI